MSVVARQELLDAATPRPWRKKRESLDADHPEIAASRWQIVAGTEKRLRNRGHFHPEDAYFTDDEFEPVSFGYDRDYGYANGGCEHEADADLIVAAVNEYGPLLACEAGLRAIIGFLPRGRILGHALEALEQLDKIRAK